MSESLSQRTRQEKLLALIWATQGSYRLRARRSCFVYVATERARELAVGRSPLARPLCTESRAAKKTPSQLDGENKTLSLESLKKNHRMKGTNFKPQNKPTVKARKRQYYHFVSQEAKAEIKLPHRHTRNERCHVKP